MSRNRNQNHNPNDYRIQNPNQVENQSSPASLVAASSLASALFGIIVGYLLGTGGSLGSSAAGAYATPLPPPVTQSAPAGLVNDAELQAYRDILARDPKNLTAATTLGNKLYDAGRYADAVPYYLQAFALDAKNANLSTDLGTALWYSGRPDEALAQYQKSLAADPKHPQTLFNIGIVRLDAKQDAIGAIAAWETLLSTSPSYADADQVRRLLTTARSRVAPLAPTRTGR